MTAQSPNFPDVLDSNEDRGARPPLRGLPVLLLLTAMALAGVGGVAVASRLAEHPSQSPAWSNPSVAYEPDGYLTTSAAGEPNANDRESRVATRAPNANDRESRVATSTTAEPNANDRESRVPTP